MLVIAGFQYGDILLFGQAKRKRPMHLLCNSTMSSKNTLAWNNGMGPQSYFATMTGHDAFQRMSLISDIILKCHAWFYIEHPKL